MHFKFKYIYGPVSSWRLGISLGIDLLSQKEKICNFNCIYCQLGATKRYTVKRKIYVQLKDFIEELKRLPQIKIDYITFSGRGEPLLAENLGEVIKAIKLIRKEPIAVLTNSSLINREEVRKELALADFLVAKLDAFSQDSLRQINRPTRNIEFRNILEGIKEFKKKYKGKLALQIMFLSSFCRGAGFIDNKNNVNELISLTNYIQPDEVQINTPLRPCNIKPLPKEEILKIKENFNSGCKGINVISVYDERLLKETLSFSDEDTLKRRGKLFCGTIRD